MPSSATPVLAVYGATSLALVALARWRQRSPTAAAAVPTGPPRPLTPAEARRVELLQPQVRAALFKLLHALHAEGLDAVIGSTGRSAAEQAEHVREGRSATTRSWHLLGRAIDLHLRDLRSGAALPDTGAGCAAYYERMRELAEGLGFRAFGCRTLRTGDGRPFTDPYHVEYREGLSYGEALARLEAGVDAVG